jgi:hypothetical protein
MVSHRFLNMNPQVQSLMASCEIRGRQSVSGTGFSPGFFHFPLPIIIPSLLEAHYHILSLSGGDFVCVQHLASCRLRKLAFIILQSRIMYEGRVPQE